MKLLQKIKQAFSCCPGTDQDEYPKGQCGYNGKTSYFVRLLPYGLASLEPQGAFVLLLNSQGQESTKFGIPSAMALRKKGLQQGEVAIYNSVTGVWVFLKADGTVEVNADTKIIGDLHVTGNTQIDGDLNVGGNVQIDGTLGVTGATTASTIACDAITINGLDFSLHVHGGIEPGAGTSGGPQ